ncbi:MAG: hypothetical protein JNK45_13470 [Myxococcales bacterium]|nr:hypothetical protein [Myxococcales bacterium]
MRRTTRILCTFLFTATGACVDDSGGPDLEDRDIVFDGAEIRARLAKDPTARSFVDLRGGSRVRFVQDPVPLDFTHFLVQCPSMPHPIPMTDFADLLGLDLERPEFTLQSAAADDVEFRSTIDPTCEFDCFELEAGDCVISC